MLKVKSSPIITCQVGPKFLSKPILIFSAEMGIKPQMFNVCFWFWRDSGVSLVGQISLLPEQPGWLWSWLALQQHWLLPRRFYTSENWLSSKCWLMLCVLCCSFFPLNCSFFINCSDLIPRGTQVLDLICFDLLSWNRTALFQMEQVHCLFPANNWFFYKCSFLKRWISS